LPSTNPADASCNAEYVTGPLSTVVLVDVLVVEVEVLVVEVPDVEVEVLDDSLGVVVVAIAVVTGGGSLVGSAAELDRMVDETAVAPSAVDAHPAAPTMPIITIAAVVHGRLIRV
jgi:hypothetical protein